MSELRISQAVRGNLNLRIFELVAFLLIFGRTKDGDVLDEGLHLVVLHARLEESYNDMTLLLPDLYSLTKVSSSRRRSRSVSGCSMRSLTGELEPPRNWLKREAKLIILNCYKLKNMLIIYSKLIFISQHLFPKLAVGRSSSSTPSTPPAAVSRVLLIANLINLVSSLHSSNTISIPVPSADVPFLPSSVCSVRLQHSLHFAILILSFGQCAVRLVETELPVLKAM